MSNTKRLIEPFKVINTGDASGNIQGAETDVRYMDVLTYIAKWTGSPVGILQFEALYDKKGSQTDVDLWQLIDFGSGTDLPVSGGAGSHTIVFTSVPFHKIRVKYVRTSGTGTMDLVVFGKEG